MNFYDAHTHFPGRETGGFIVGLEGEPWFDENSSAFRVPGRILHNEAVEAFAKGNPNYMSFMYVEAGAVHDVGRYRCCALKYHPRREGYSPDEVIESISVLRPKAVMIDTLNEPGWVPYDYWKVVRAFPETAFFLPHAGGYLVNDFIKICHFQKNVYIDFTLTHTNFGSISGNPLPYVDEAIKYALNSPFRERVLMGSDLPFFNQMDVVAYYERLGKLEMLNNNFERVFEKLKC